jgi:DNA-binding SARP family transcriptional activator
MGQMEQLDIRLLGTPRIEVGGQPIEVDTRKATALLAYLAVTATRHGRDTLAAMFWPEADDERARGALRRTLSTLNAALGAGWLAIDRETVGLHAHAGLWLDIDAFRRLARERSTLPQAVELFRGDFMAGFALRDSPAFDDWQLYQSEAIQAELASALERLMDALADAGEFDAAIAAARRRLALDALHEPSHRRLMECLARAGQRGAALRQ